MGKRIGICDSRRSATAADKVQATVEPPVLEVGVRHVGPRGVLAGADKGDAPRPEKTGKTLPPDPALHVISQPYLTIHEAAPFKIERIGPPPTESPDRP